MRTASRALLVCKPPIRCSSSAVASARSGGNLAIASCTRFSPNSVCPAASAARTAAAGMVLETAIRRHILGAAIGPQRRLRHPGANAPQVLGNLPGSVGL